MKNPSETKSIASIKKLRGSVKLPSDFNYKLELAAALQEKYGKVEHKYSKKTKSQKLK